MQWLRDGLGIIKRADESGTLAADADPNQHVYLVPAFVGLGAPHWDPEARGALFGLTRGTGPKELARAALESVCFQTVDLIAGHAGRLAGHGRPGDGAARRRRHDGVGLDDAVPGRPAGCTVDRPTVQETTALGAAYLAGLSAGIFPDPARFADSWRLERRFNPAMEEAKRRQKLAGWKDAVARTLSRPS